MKKILLYLFIASMCFNGALNATSSSQRLIKSLYGIGITLAIAPTMYTKYKKSNDNQLTQSEKKNCLHIRQSGLALLGTSFLADCYTGGPFMNLIKNHPRMSTLTGTAIGVGIGAVGGIAYVCMNLLKR